MSADRIWHQNFYNSMRIRNIFINLRQRRWWVRWWTGRTILFFVRVSVKTALKPNSQSAFHRYMDTDCFCSIVCLLREQIKLNKCERRWAFAQPSPSSTLYLFSASCLSSSSLSFFLSLDIANFFHTLEKRIRRTEELLCLEIQNAKQLMKKNRQDSIKNYVIRFVN